MAAFYQRFLQDGWSLEPLGLEDRGADGGYFCTPIGARCIGWPGVDGIHFCFIRGYRELVFAVSPMNTPGTCVHPVAKTFRDFLRLLLSCSEAALEQLWQWDRETFASFTAQEIRPEAVLAYGSRLAEAYGLRPMKDPYGYVRALQEEFRENSLSFQAEYENHCRELEAQRPWTVYFSGARYGVEEEKPGQEMVLNREFCWDGQLWKLLSLYLCQDGLVGDVAVPVEREKLEAYVERWIFLEEMGMTEEQQNQAQEENSFRLEVQIFAEINGHTGGNVHSRCEYWNPLHEDPEAGRWLDHYGLDRNTGWMFQRVCWPFRWQERGLERLTLRLKEEPAWIDGPEFTARQGERIEFVRPATGQHHTLIVEEGPWEETVDLRQIPDMEVPTYCRAMTWRVEPELPKDVLYIRDRDPGDQPRCSTNGVTSCVGIIGGADGPTAVLVGSANGPEKHVAVSGLYFDLPEQTHWKLRFREQRRAEKKVNVIE